MLKLIVCENREMARQEWLKDIGSHPSKMVVNNVPFYARTPAGDERRYVSQHHELEPYMGLHCTIELRNVSSAAWERYAAKQNARMHQ